ncbi:MAG TPA: 4-hydroxy-tetrahydrodipicolinate reductase [Spirochaetota bacterium]|nr:4-hydroxy-tetrahydrodipicolinate reductase [Spirochaetota bacterium]HPL16662.1 4-hydroxy-tetrahydrodipicolinate reductase [Spirochaetota bacterium]HQF09972.1 4-hydroxy-tetrahydrodipicolinate reductase [Spirochaetota bacterium]HQH98677.1 4-hydroxy-tetrahydrodipicolinate reductase [Spirochaetota bacterium]HQJ72392.1 4-hydroxy-tetrahydrodipicolinate reductase [Spirochaetota bacterium]
MKIGICGICGRMGVSVLKIMLERRHVLAAAFDHEGAPRFGDDAGRLVGGEGLNVTITAINRDDVRKADGIIDFSAPAASMRLIEEALSAGKPLVIGTTGLSDDQKKEIEKASRRIPVLFSPNMSVGVNLLFKLTETAARALNTDYDVEIFEAHHRFKKDAPSGTARRLLEIVRENMGGLEDAKEVPGRDGIVGERTKNEIGILAMRGGDIVGEHTVFFTTFGERIELTHRATSREILSSGAVTAMEFLAGKPAGLYTMYDVLGL